jgi:hypothetical protein
MTRWDSPQRTPERITLLSHVAKQFQMPMTKVLHGNVQEIVHDTYTIDRHKVPAEIRGCSIGAFSIDESRSFIIEYTTY